MKVPARSAAAMSISPLRAVTSRPSRVKVTVSTGAPSTPVATDGPVPAEELSREAVVGSLIGAALVFDVHEELVAEHLDGRGDGRGDGGAEHADGGLLGRPGQAGSDVVARIEEEVEVLLAAVARLDAGHDALEPARALATG